MPEAKPVRKSYTVGFDRELEAMALIKKGMERLQYPTERERVLRWAIERWTCSTTDVTRTVGMFHSTGKIKND